MTNDPKTALSVEECRTALPLGVPARLATLALRPNALRATWATSGNVCLSALAGRGGEYPAYRAALCIAQFLGNGAFTRIKVAS